MTCELTLPPNPELPVRGISAHRGGLFGCSANTIGAFRQAIDLGVHQIEFDVRPTLDNILVVAHDDVIYGKHQTLRISESTIDQVKTVELPTCGEERARNEHIPTFEEALSIMPRNMWINVDIKDNDPHVGQLAAETVAKVDRFNQVIFSARSKAAPEIRQFSEQANTQAWISNMNRELFRCQYVNTTIRSRADFIQLVEVPYLPFVRGKPSPDTMEKLDKAGVRVNYSWLREDKKEKLQQKLEDLFTRGVDFVLVDHVEQAMNAADCLGIPRLSPIW